MQLSGIHHVAVICSDYEKSKWFYSSVLGLKLEAEHYREERSSYKTDFSLNGVYVLELFSFPSPPPRASRPESAGLRHLAFATEDIESWHESMRKKGLNPEDMRIDEFTSKRFFFIEDPDGLPIEFYEA